SAVITARSAISSSNSGAALTGGFPASVLDRVRQLPDVGAAAGSIADTAKLVGRNGKTFSTHGAPSIAVSVDPKEQRFNPLILVAGSWPATSSEVAIDKASADKQHYKVGDTIGVIARGPEKPFSISGIVKFGTVSSIGAATIAVFDLPTAQQLFNKVGKFDAVRVAGKGSVSESKLASEIRPLLPPTAQVRTAEAQVKQETKDVGFVGVIQKILLGFGGVALFVGAFVIFNTISITVAQRMRELATLRTIGASRRQVMLSVLGEALIVGALAAATGLFLGFGLAVGLDKLMSSIGIDLPKSATVFATRTVVVSLVVGTLITLLSALRPALRATRVPPIAAVREGAELPPGRLSFLGPPLKAIVAAAGIALLTAVAALASGIRNTVHGTFKKTFVADYAVTSPDGFTPFAPASERTLARVPGVTVVSGERVGDGRAFGGTVQVSAVNGSV